MIYVVVLAVVVAALLATAIYKSFAVRTRTDFMVAGRKLAWPVLVFTLLSSWIGAGSLFAGGENAYRNGFAALWQPAGGWVGLALIWFIAGRARRFAQFTVPDLLETRFNAAARVMATIAIVIAYTVITSYQFKGGGDVLHLIFPAVERNTGMYIVAAFVIVLTAAAGMASIAYTDLIIGSMVTIIVVIAVPVLLGKVGGWEHVHATLPATHFQILGNVTFSQALGWLIPTTLLLLGNQTMYQKFFSARSERDARWAVVGWIVGTLLLETLLITLAVIGSSILHTDHPREIIPMTARRGLPAVLGALLLGGVFAKVVSTANNYLFSPSTNLIQDVYLRFIDRRASEKRTLIASRLIVLLLGVLALLLATQFESVLNASVYAYTIYGTAVTPAVLAVFLWKRATTAGAITSIVAGTVVTVAGNLMQFSPELVVYPAVAASVVSLIAVSLFTAPPDPAKLKALYD